MNAVIIRMLVHFVTYNLAQAPKGMLALHTDAWQLAARL